MENRGETQGARYGAEAPRHRVGHSASLPSVSLQVASRRSTCPTAAAGSAGVPDPGQKGIDRPVQQPRQHRSHRQSRCGRSSASEVSETRSMGICCWIRVIRQNLGRARTAHNGMGPTGLAGGGLPVGSLLPEPSRQSPGMSPGGGHPRGKLGEQLDRVATLHQRQRLTWAGPAEHALRFERKAETRGPRTGRSYAMGPHV